MTNESRGVYLSLESISKSFASKLICLWSRVYLFCMLAFWSLIYPNSPSNSSWSDSLAECGMTPVANPTPIHIGKASQLIPQLKQMSLFAHQITRLLPYYRSDSLGMDLWSNLSQESLGTIHTIPQGHQLAPTLSQGSVNVPNPIPWGMPLVVHPWGCVDFLVYGILWLQLVA